MISRLRILSTASCSFAGDGLAPADFSSSVAMKSSDSATIVFSTVLGPAMLALEPTARNSNLLPVNANGLVRLRSPASRGSCGSVPAPRSSVPPRFVRLGAALLDLLEDVGQLLAQEDRDDRRRRLVGAQAVVVARRRDRRRAAGRRACAPPG